VLAHRNVGCREQGHLIKQTTTLKRRRGGAQTEISLATLAYNLKGMLAMLGGENLRVLLAVQPAPAAKITVSPIARRIKSKYESDQ